MKIEDYDSAKIYMENILACILESIQSKCRHNWKMIKDGDSYTEDIYACTKCRKVKS